MDNQTDILTRTAMALTHQAFVLHNGVGATLGDFSDGGFHVPDTRNGAYRNTMIHGNDHCFSGVAVDNALHPNAFA